MPLIHSPAPQLTAKWWPLLLTAAPIAAQQDPVHQVARPVIVTATKTRQDPFDVPYSVTHLGGKTIRTEQQSRTAPEALRDLPGVSVQKTAHGQGSPKFRGQTGFHTLLLVDGIRINDSTWRSGNVEYWNHLDPFSFDRFEVVRGPGSVLWGSDAVAGVGHAFQKGRTSFEPGVHADWFQSARYGSAEHSFVGRLESAGNLGTDFGWHLGLSYRDYGDLEAGDGVGRLNGTGYRDRDGDVKLTFVLDGGQRIHVTAQRNFLKDVPRTHSTIDNVAWRRLTSGNNQVREHDHRRQLYYVTWEGEGSGWFDSFTTTLSYRDRYERETRLRNNGRLQFNVTEVSSLGVTAQFAKKTDFGHLVYGVDWYHDFVDSEYRQYDSGVLTTRDRGPVAGDADYDLVGIYVQDTIPLREDTDLLAGVRWSYAALSADDVAVPGGSSSVDHVSDHWSSVTGTLRAIYKPAPTWRLFGGFAQGFRAPNLSDTTRFDIARSGEQEVPATDLDPEFYYSFEVGGRYDDGELNLQITGYHTLVRDQISRFRTGNTVNGAPEVSKANIGDGWIAGFEVEATYALSRIGLADFEAFGFFDYVDGHVDQLDDAGNEIEDRQKAIPPPSGLLGLRWRDPVRYLGAEFFARMAYHVKPSRYTQKDVNNTQRIPPDGLPGYAAIGVRGWYEIDEHITASLAVENINDADYRIMDSGLQSPGTNVILTIQSRF